MFALFDTNRLGLSGPSNSRNNFVHNFWPIMFSHPGTLSYTPTRKNGLTSRSSDVWLGSLGMLANSSTPTTPTLSPKQRIDSNRDCQLLLLATLQGVEQDFKSRQRAVNLIDGMDDARKNELIDFLFAPNGVIPSTLENNACKHFECSSDELDGVIDSDTLETFLDLWAKIYLQILPNFVAMVYPLEKHDSRLQIRHKFLTFFRDKVLIRVLSKLEFNTRIVQVLYPLLFTVDVQTLSNSKKYWIFKDFLNKLLGIEKSTNRKLSVLSNDSDALSPLPVLPRPPPNPPPKSLNRQVSEANLSTGIFGKIRHSRHSSLDKDEKNRSNTLPLAPKRSVHFSDHPEPGFDEESVVEI